MVNDFGDLPGDLRGETNDVSQAPEDGWRTVALVDNLQIGVFIMVGAAFAFNFWVFVKKFGILWHSLTIPKGGQFDLDDKAREMLNKGAINTANSWAVSQFYCTP